MHNEDILNVKVAEKIHQIGEECFQKCGVRIYLVAVQTTNGEKIRAYEKRLSEKLESPFVLLALTVKEHKVDIMASNDAKALIDAEDTLDDVVIPLIVDKGKNSQASKYNAGLLQGYSDLAEQVASSKKVELQSVIGNESRNTITFVKIIVYGSLLLVLGTWIYRRIKR